jgi:hypothetical protein
VFSDTAQDKSTHGNMFRMRLQGAMNSPVLDWSGDITIISQDHGETLLVALLVDQATLHAFLDRFQNLTLTILPDEHIGDENHQVNSV